VAVIGITNKSLRAWMTGLLGQPYPMTRASYDLTRLRRNGLITRLPGISTYRLTTDGQLFVVFYTKVHDHVLYPPMAGQHIAVPARNPPRPAHHRPTYQQPHRRGRTPASGLNPRARTATQPGNAGARLRAPPVRVGLLRCLWVGGTGIEQWPLPCQGRSDCGSGAS
jgi:hypothetical protein